MVDSVGGVGGFGGIQGIGGPSWDDKQYAVTMVQRVYSDVQGLVDSPTGDPVQLQNDVSSLQKAMQQGGFPANITKEVNDFCQQAGQYANMTPQDMNSFYAQANTLGNDIYNC